MTHEEIYDLIELQNKMYKKCNKICCELGRYQEFWKYMDNFHIDNDKIICTGERYWPYGGYDEYEDTLDINLLYYSDKEIKKYVDDLIEKKKKEDFLKKEKELQQKEYQEMQEYLRLKGKYEK